MEYLKKSTKFILSLLVCMICSIFTTYFCYKSFNKNECDVNVLHEENSLGNIEEKVDNTSEEIKLGDGTNLTFDSNYVNYDNTKSGVKSGNVQGAIDELYQCASDYAAYNTRLTNAENNKSNKTETVSNVEWDATNKKITKTINGTTSDVVTGANILSGLTSNQVTTALGYTPPTQDTNTTYSAANDGGLSLSSNAFSLSNSGVSAGSYGPSANATPGYGSTFNVPYITVDAKGRVTSASTKTVTIPASDNTNTTYSAASGGGLSLSSNAFSIANSGVTAGSYGPSANATPGYGSTFNVPYITVNAKGQVTAASTKTITIPASDNTNTTYSAASGGGLSLSSNAFSIANSGVTAGSYGPSANATPGYGSTFNVPYITVNAKGQVTAASTKTITIPASDNTNTWRGIQNNLTSTSTTDSLSAAQGKVLNDKIMHAAAITATVKFTKTSGVIAAARYGRIGFLTFNIGNSAAIPAGGQLATLNVTTAIDIEALLRCGDTVLSVYLTGSTIKTNPAIPANCWLEGQIIFPVSDSW